MTAPSLRRAEEHLAQAIQKQVRLGGKEAEVAATIAREYAIKTYGSGSDTPDSLSLVSFYLQAGLDVCGQRGT